MSLNILELRDAIFGDLAQDDIVISETNGELTPPEGYFSDNEHDSEYPYEVTINEQLPVINPTGNKSDDDYYEVTSRRGVIRNPGKKLPPTDNDIASFSEDGEIPEMEDDDDGNLQGKRVQAVEQHRLATVLADRILSHLVDNLWTEDAANNIEATRELIQYLVERVLTLATTTKDLSSAINSQATAITTVVTVLQTMIAQLGTAAPSLAASTTQINTVNVSDSVTTAATADANMQKVLDDLEGSFATDLAAIKYDNSKAVK